MKHCAGNLKKIQKTYEVARRSLGVYQLLVRTLSQAQHEGDLARLKWTQQKIKETTQRMNDNSTSAQQLLTAEIASLESMNSFMRKEDKFFCGDKFPGTVLTNGTDFQMSLNHHKENEYNYIMPIRILGGGATGF